MNVLILTPDAVGSTLLQRLITIYMQFHKFEKPVINLHELTNGLVKYHNSDFNQEVLGKQHDKWGYHQSLQQIVELLDSVDHYKTSRLAHYHIRNRQDAIEDQIPFYQYLNQNFYIISCRRHNIFEHSLSWCLSKITKKLNVYSGTEKINSFFDLYKSGIEIDPNSMIQTLNAYKEYVAWCNNHFDVANYFFYEEHLPNIEKYILNLPIFSQQSQQLTWQDNFGLKFDTWNLHHYVTSDLGTLALEHPDKFAQLCNQTKNIQGVAKEIQLIEDFNKVRDPSWPEIKTVQDYLNIPEHIRNEVENLHNVKLGTDTTIVEHKQLPKPLIELLPQTHQEFVQKNNFVYNKSMEKIQNMIDQGILIGAPPIKKQTMAEKKYIIKNYQHLLNVYNQWIVQNPELGQPIDNDTLDKFAQIEQSRWKPGGSAVVVPD